MKEINSALRGSLFILPCHCVYDTALNCIYVEHPEDLAMFIADLRAACGLVRERWGNNEQQQEGGDSHVVKRILTITNDIIIMMDKIPNCADMIIQFF